MSRARITVDDQLIERISSLFDLRRPNEAALRAVVAQIADPARRHITPGGYPEIVADLATGVGKTYLMAALVEYVAQQGVRNVLVVTPNSTIQRKTIANFDAASAKHVRGAELVPFVVTPENFRTAQTGAIMRSPDRVKVFVFNVQQLTKPTQNMTRRTRTPDEVLGAALYDHLVAAKDLLVIADEHHVYREKAPKFSGAVRDVDPIALVGLTATPDKADIPKLAFEYTLGEAIADGYVKIPVIAYRSGGMSSVDVQLGDAVALLRRKETSYRQYEEATGAGAVKPVLFVVTQTVEEANRTGEKLIDDGLVGASNEVLVITEESSDAALAELDRVESPASPVRVIVSVNKLREGWDVKNIAVIVALRRLASESLTEQILGRGLRLPWGRRTGWEDVDQVDLVVHDKWEQLLRQKDVLKQRLMTPASAVDTDDTGAARVEPSDEESEAARRHRDQTGTVGPDVLPPAPADDEPAHDGAGSGSTGGDEQGEQAGRDGTGSGGMPDLENLMWRDLEREVDPDLPVDTYRVAGAPTIVFPRRDRIVIAGRFSVADIPHADARALGRKFTGNADIPLNRKKIDARREGDDVVIAEGRAGAAIAHQQVLTVDTVRGDLVSAVQRLRVVSWTREARNATFALVDAFLDGARDASGDDWTDTRLRQAVRSIESLVREAAKKTRTVVEHRITEVVVPVEPVPVVPSKALSAEQGRFVKGAQYEGWLRSIMPYASFDAERTEWRIAGILESELADVEYWLRLPSTGDVYLPWSGGRYYPDFIAIDKAGVRWLIEGKDDASLERSDPVVLEKKRVAEEWVRHVNATGDYGHWEYLFATERDVAAAQGSWKLLKSICRD